jgi:hypothetical protein
MKKVLLTAPWILSAGLGAVACNEKPQEPDTVRTAEATIATPAFDLPAGWSRDTESQRGELRARYRIGRTGGDGEDVEMTVRFFGTGANGDPAKVLPRWWAEFDGDPASSAKKRALTSPAGPIDVYDFVGSYRVDMGPKHKGKSPVQMIKPEYRMVGAVLHTKDRGNWYLRLVGPVRTVDAAADDFEKMLATLK